MKIVYFFLLSLILLGVAHAFHWGMNIFFVTLLPTALVLFSIDNPRRKRRRYHPPVTTYQAFPEYPLEASLSHYTKGYRHDGDASSSYVPYQQVPGRTFDQDSPYGEQLGQFPDYEQPQVLYPANMPPEDYQP